MARFTVPLVRALGLHERAACVVSGDTAPKPKPDPAPLLHALAATRADAGAALYVGDDLRDIQAGRAAGMRTVAVSYGYLGDGPHYSSGAPTISSTRPPNCCRSCSPDAPGAMIPMRREHLREIGC